MAAQRAKPAETGAEAKVPAADSTTSSSANAAPSEATAPAASAPEPAKDSAPRDEPKAPTESAKAAAAPKATAKAPAEPVYRVAKGRSVTTRRGIVDAGTVLDPAKDVHGGVERLEELVALGAVTKS